MTPGRLRGSSGPMLTDEERAKARAWGRRRAAEAPPVTPEETAALKRALFPEGVPDVDPVDPGFDKEKEDG